MRKTIFVLSLATAIIAAFIMGYLANIKTDGDYLEQNEMVSTKKQLISPHEGVNTNMETDLEKEEDKTNEETNEKIIWYEKVLGLLTNGEKLDYEEITSDNDEIVVYLKNTPSDYYEREELLIKLGVEFAGYDSVSFWYDEEQAELYVDGKLDKNEDPLLPPYTGVFGEIARDADDRLHLLLHGSTGGPLDLNFGKYNTSN
ncbi:hypothetical protein [Paenibacillus harenae]|uniref:hypothetical protein n=1 Tax=Paenibacillus harenae TaxID=306543 RepID=UPI00279426B0|nr:hypothetical protein [Paenibacillus harenae]MDQ0063570.1 hypothetical protein [Paenibacillus harenae]